MRLGRIKMKSNNKKVDWRVVIFGMACITGLEAYALNLGFDGLLLTTVIGILAVGAGVAIPRAKVYK